MQKILKMDEDMVIRNLIKDRSIEIQLQTAPSYIKLFLNESVDDSIVLVYKKLVGYIWYYHLCLFGLGTRRYKCT